MKFIRIFLFVLIIIGIGLLCTERIWVPKLVDKIILNENSSKAIKTVPIDTNKVTKIEYKNSEYGFTFSLPLSWKGYSVIVDNWVGNMIDSKTNESIKGPKILIRHPLWTSSVIRQDIPIMVFTLSQWDLILKEKLSVSAAPIGPSELGRNSKYVFALPARYNFAFPVGFEEVEKIMESKPLQAF